MAHTTFLQFPIDKLLKKKKLAKLAKVNSKMLLFEKTLKYLEKTFKQIIPMSTKLLTTCAVKKKVKLTLSELADSLASSNKTAVIPLSKHL